MAVNDEPAWRNKPMNRANANPTADCITWYNMAVDQEASHDRLFVTLASDGWVGEGWAASFS